MKSSSFTTGLALALSLAVAGAASAQTAQRPDRGVAAQSDSGFAAPVAEASAVDREACCCAAST